MSISEFVCHGEGSDMCVFVSYALFYFVLHLLCYVLDYHHHHHHDIPVGMRSKCSLRPPRKYFDEQLHFPACTSSPTSFTIASFYSVPTGNLSQTASLQELVPSSTSSVENWRQLMLMPSACVS